MRAEFVFGYLLLLFAAIEIVAILVDEHRQNTARLRAQARHRHPSAQRRAAKAITKSGR